MKLVTSSFVKGLIGPGSGLGDLVAGREGKDNFEANVQTASDDFFSQGQVAWDKYKEEEKDIEARIKLLMASGVESKELAVALANQDQTSFDKLIEGYREQQGRTQDNLKFRDYVQAEGLPMEDDPTRSPFGPTELPAQRVVADLTDATIDESVRRIVGTVRPGTLSRAEERTFTSNLRDNFTKMGLGPRSFRGDLARQEGLEDAMQRRPAGVSEEEWLGFIEDNIEKGDPSTVKFRATPFSRAAEIEFSTLENQFETSVLELEALRRKAKTEEEYDIMRGQSFKDLGYTLSEDMINMASRVGIDLTEDMLLKDFETEFGLKGPVIELFIKMDKANQQGKTKYSDTAHFRNVKEGRVKALRYYAGAGLGKPTTDFISGNSTFESPNRYVTSVSAAIDSAGQKRSEHVFDAITNQNMTQPEAHAYADAKF